MPFINNTFLTLHNSHSLGYSFLAPEMYSDPIFLAEIPENAYIKYFAPEYSLKTPGGLIVCHSTETSCDF